MKLGRSKRETGAEDSENKENLIRAYGKAESLVNSVEQQAVEISVRKPEIEEEKSLGNITDPTIFHALFLSGKDDRNGDLVNRLAMINIEAMKLAQEQKTKHLNLDGRKSRFSPSGRRRKLEQ